DARRRLGLEILTAGHDGQSRVDARVTRVGGCTVAEELFGDRILGTRRRMIEQPRARAGVILGTLRAIRSRGRGARAQTEFAVAVVLVVTEETDGVVFGHITAARFFERRFTLERVPGERRTARIDLHTLQLADEIRSDWGYVTWIKTGVTAISVIGTARR